MAESKPIERFEQEQAEYRSLSGALAQGAAEGTAGVATGALIGVAAHEGRKVVAKLGSLGKQKQEPQK
jgi:hypothetical protein